MGSSGKRKLADLRDLFGLVWKESSGFVKRRLALTLLLVAVTSFLTTLGPVALKLLVDSFTLSNGGPGVPIVWLVVLYLFSQTVGRVLGELRTYVDAQAHRRMYRVLSERVFSHIMALPLLFHLNRRTGAVSETLTNGLQGYQVVVQQTVQTLLPIIVELTTVAVVLIRVQQEVFMFVFFFALAGYALVFAHGVSRITAAAREASTAQTDERAIMTDSILNYETVKFFTAEPLVASRLDVALSRTEAGWLSFFRSKALNGLLTTTVFGAFLAVTTGYAVHAVTQGSMTVGDFVLVNAYMFQLVRPIEMLGYALQGTSQGLAFVEKMLDLLRETPEPNSTARSVSFNAAGSLEFRDVAVRYHSQRPVLDHVSFVLPSGKTLGIAGASGAGKSTLVRLLVRLLEPERGEILLDGQPIRDVPLRQLREAIAVVPQDTMLFDDSIAYNIAFGKPGSTRAEVEEAAKLAQLHELIMSLPEGYETRVGERGLKLSGGEKQRVSIARATLKRPRLYVFDEATSSLDSRTEAEILKNLQQISQSSTTLIIAHRLSTIVHADQIVVLERGEIAESGTHDSLLDANGKYALLWRAQQRATTKGIKPAVSGAPAGTRT